LECWDRKEKKFVAVKIIRAIEKYRVAAMMEVLLLSVIATGTLVPSFSWRF